MNSKFLPLLTILSSCWIASEAASTPPISDTLHQVPRQWQPVADDIYLQEVGERILTTKPVTSLSCHLGVLHAVVGGVLHRLEGGRLVAESTAPADVSRLCSLAGALWAATPKGPWRLDSQGWRQVGDQPIVDFCLHLGQVHAATVDGIFRWEGDRFVDAKPKDGWLSNDSTMLQEDFTQLLADPVTMGPIKRIGSYLGTLYFLQDDGLALFEGRTLITDPVDWGFWPSPVFRDLLVQGSRLLVATDRGLGVVRGMALSSIRGADGLPVEDTTCLARGFGDDIWIGTQRGAIRQVGSQFHYFGADLWLPQEQVQDICVADRTVYIATGGGVAIIRYEPYTLAKKAAYFEREMEEWGFQRLGFVHMIHQNGKGEWIRSISDNDGGRSSGYLAAMAYKYAATHDPAARQAAVNTFEALVWLREITGVPGLIARAVWSVPADQGQRSTRGSGGLPAKWFPTSDGKWFWKGDTSSDEVNGHFYAVSLFHDLVAEGGEKLRAAKHLAAVTSHIIDQGWVLRDPDGKPTRWGRWNPEYLLVPYGFESRGLNGMEAQTYVTTALALTGEAKYQQGLEQTLKWRYQTYTLRQKITFPPEQVVPWDDELAFRCYVPLLRYATDPDLRSIYLRSLARHWEVQRMQQVPFYNFIYGFLSGNDCEAPQAVQHLRDWPLDLTGHHYHNSHRADLGVKQADYIPYGSGPRSLSPRETGPRWGSRSGLVLDGGRGERVVTPPICWLEDYWMGRCFGFIQAPSTTESSAVALSPRATRRQGAAPYGGPPRPALQ